MGTLVPSAAAVPSYNCAAKGCTCQATAMRSKMAGRGRGLEPTRPLQRMEEGGAGRGLGGLKKSSSGGGGGSTGTLLESVRYLEQGGKLSSS